MRKISKKREKSSNDPSLNSAGTYCQQAYKLGALSLFVMKSQTFTTQQRNSKQKSIYINNSLDKLAIEISAPQQLALHDVEFSAGTDFFNSYISINLSGAANLVTEITKNTQRSCIGPDAGLI